MKKCIGALFWLLATMANAADLPAAWQAAAAWKAGADVAPLLAIEQEQIASMATPDARAAHAARLVAVVTDKASSPDARQWACLQLRVAGTAAEVPQVAAMLMADDPSLADAARQALEGIPDAAAAAALRTALPAASGAMRIGIIAALGRRHDAAAVPLLVPLASAADTTVAAAARNALGHISTAEALEALQSVAEAAGIPTPPALVEPLLRAAEAAHGRGDAAAAGVVRQRLAAAGQPPRVRQATFTAELAEADAAARAGMISAWIAGDDLDRRAVACGRAAELDDASLARMLATAASLSPTARLAVVSAAARSRSPEVTKPLAQLVTDPLPDVRIAALESLAATAAAKAVPVIVTAAGSDDRVEVRMAARAALATMPRRFIDDSVLAAMAKAATSAEELAGGLAELGGSSTWNRLAELAAGGDTAAAVAAIAALERIASPTAADMQRLVEVYAAVTGDDRRDAVGRVLVRLAKRADGKPDGDAGGDAADVVLTAADRAGLAEATVLPLAGRMGGARALARIDAALGSADPAIREAAAAALCLWPTADVADRLRTMAERGLADPATRPAGRRALRAHVRVISLPADRPASAVLADLQAAMRLAEQGNPDDRAYVLERTAAAVRTMDSVKWIAGYLDAADPAAAEPQAACRALVALAHHRGLRQPNVERFDVILERVAAVTRDPALADRAARYKAGL
jgi:HEAT repeat protein